MTKIKALASIPGPADIGVFGKVTMKQRTGLRLPHAHKIGRCLEATFVTGSTARVQPFRPFFLLAAIDAIAGVAIWFFAGLGIAPVELGGIPVALWHRQELFFGMIPAELAGVLLTALPRWTGRQAISSTTLRAFWALWLVGRAAHALVAAAAAPIAAIFIALLALNVAYNIIAVHDRRNIKIAVLLFLFSLGTLTAGTQPLEAASEYGSRLSLAAILGLVIVLGGRIVPSLTAAYVDASVELSSKSAKKWIEGIAAVTATIGLAAWVAAPTFEGTALTCTIAAIGQIARLVQWRIWRTLTTPAVLVLQIGYGWIPVGFVLAAVQAVQPGHAVESAAVHAWTVGAVASTCLGVMASMIRRQTGTAFKSSKLLSAAYVCALAAALVRLLAEHFTSAQVLWLGLAGLAWISAYALFLIVFGRVLLGGKAVPAPTLRPNGRLR